MNILTYLSKSVCPSQSFTGRPHSTQFLRGWVIYFAHRHEPLVMHKHSSVVKLGCLSLPMFEPWTLLVCKSFYPNRADQQSAPLYGYDRSLTLKYQTRVKIVSKDKHYSLLLFGKQFNKLERLYKSAYPSGAECSTLWV